MAKRGRVTHKKSVNRSQNKNPKLSPFQRELKRDRLANQAPTAQQIIKADERVSISGRAVFNFLQRRAEGLKRQQESKKKKKKKKKSNLTSNNDGREEKKQEETKEEQVKKSDSKGVTSLNAELSVVAMPAIKSDEVAQRIQRKKERKHAMKTVKHLLAGKERIAEIERKITEQAAKSSNKDNKKGSKKKRLRDNDGNSNEVNKSNDVQASSGSGEEQREKKKLRTSRILFEVPVPDGGDKPHSPMARQNTKTNRVKYAGFEDIVDVVRFGERVDAPPLLDVVPTKNKLNVISASLEQKGTGGAKSARRQNAYSDVIVPASSERNAGSEKVQAEMELLRAKVMAAYSKNKWKHNKAGGDIMKHQFPTTA